MADTDLIPLLRREANHSGVWFADRLHDAATRLQRYEAALQSAQHALGIIAGSSIQPRLATLARLESAEINRLRTQEAGE